MDFAIDTKPAGKDRSPGIGNVWYGELSAFDVIATPPASPASQAEKVTISDTHTFTDPVTEGFRKLYTTDTLRDLQDERTGGRDSRGKKVIVNCFYPGTKKEFEAFLLDDPELIVIVEPFPCDGTTKIQVGTKCSPARIMEDSFQSQRIDATEGKGYTFQLVAYQSSLLFYDGAITEPTG